MKTSNKDIIFTVIHDYIKKEKSFTFYDVAKASKKKGCSLDKFKIRHIVKNAYYPIHYKITPIMVEDIIIEVYHSENKNPNRYKYTSIISEIKKTPKVKKVRQISNANNSGKSKKELFDDLNSAKLKTRYLVPCSMVRKAGFIRREPLSMVFHKDHIELVRAKLNNVMQSCIRLPKYTGKVDAFGSFKILTKFFIEEYGSVDVIDIVAVPGNIKIFIKK